jgi:hypothetical protein
MLQKLEVDIMGLNAVWIGFSFLLETTGDYIP